MQRDDAGFTLLEMLVAILITLVVLALALGTLTQGFRAAEGVTLVADMEENLRAGMTFLVRDLLEAGEGLPTGGIPIPATMNAASPPANTAPLTKRPGPCPAPCASPLTFPNTYSTWPGVAPAPGLVPANAVGNPNGILINRTSDLINIVYADTTLPLNVNPINSAANPVCPGTITTAGTTVTVTFAPACTKISNGNVSVTAGNLIMLSNAKGYAILTVTTANVAANSLTFAAGDAFGLNGTVAAQGTIAQLQNPPASNTYPPTSATRIWMITYYIDNLTDSTRPQLMRQVNFGPAQSVGQVLEDLQITYDLSNGSPTPPVNVPQPIYPDTPSEIRKVNLYLAGRSDGRFAQSGQFFRQNLLTQVTLRAMAYIPKYN
jgi:prepilin-type N-terminal cleavage/methylation domain-containing protein